MSYTLIRNGTLIDGTGKTPISNAAVLVKDNRIEAVDRADRIRRPDAAVTEIDVGGGTILPGFIDAHVHLVVEGVSMERDMLKPFSMRFFEAVPRMRRTLDAGITTVRDAGGADAGLKQAVETGVVPGPRMQISITMLSITGGHGDGWMLGGDQWKFFPEYPGCPDCICDGVDGVRKKVREVLRAGAEVIKISTTGGVLSPTDHPQNSQFSPEELEAIVSEAKLRGGLKVMAHAQGANGVKNALRAGIHSIEHGIYLDDEAIELMLERGAYLVPTLLALLTILEVGEKGGMPEYGVRKARETIEIHSDSMARAHKAGVKIAMGTDAGVMAHGTNLREMGLMVNIGMTPMQSIVATTKTAAECLGWDDRVGTVEPGKLADIVIAKTDPLKDIRSLENVDNITVVMKDGVIVKRIVG